MRTVVLPNHDTTYTVGRLQLAGGPRVIDVPDTAGRYYVIQLLDAYSNTFAYVGRRTTGTRPGSYAVVPPGYTGTLPAGVKRIQSPTNLVWLLGRTLVRDEADMPAVAELMRGYRITALDAWTAGQRQNPLLLGAFPATPPVVIPTGLDYFARLGEILASDPPPKGDACALQGVRARQASGPTASPPAAPSSPRSEPASGSWRARSSAPTASAPSATTAGLTPAPTSAPTAATTWAVP